MFKWVYRIEGVYLTENLRRLNLMGQSSFINENGVMYKFGRYCKLMLCGEKLSYKKIEQ